MFALFVFVLISFLNAIFSPKLTLFCIQNTDVRAARNVVAWDNAIFWAILKHSEVAVNVDKGSDMFFVPPRPRWFSLGDNFAGLLLASTTEEERRRTDKIFSQLLPQYSFHSFLACMSFLPLLHNSSPKWMLFLLQACQIKE